MKILTKEEEAAHYRATVTGGLKGLAWGLGLGTISVAAASRRFAGFRSLTIQFRTFLVMSTSTFVGVIAADRASRGFEQSQHPDLAYTDKTIQLQRELELQKSAGQRALDWGRENRYPIVFGSWVASMGAAFGIVSRNKYLTGQQKLVQARVYAQGLTLAVLLASFAIEANDANKGKGRWETIKVLDPTDPTHQRLIEKKIHHERYQGEDQWMDMVEAEERRIKEREKAREQAKATSS